ncbi:MAG: tRNA 2-selenouridine(34) synthase MnmH [Bacteroidetes bacterium]|nr:tRNA 2-selenouridine(34) synthase MnmH [Bacteroidota bacterium]
MHSPLPIERFLAAGLPLIDVRSPAEYLKGHIPGATNVALFSDEERASVGTLYKQQGRDAAMLEGLRIAGPKLAWLVEQARRIAPDGRIGVHCWRGGERSASVAWLLRKAGFNEVATLERGYKAFREQVLAALAKPWNLYVLGGYTGTGKTVILERLRELGEAVVNLEKLARHKGSAFGGIGEEAQPSTEHFENLLWAALKELGNSRPIWVEDESQMIGRAKIPDSFFAQIRSSPIWFVDMPLGQRAKQLVETYGNYPADQLAEAIKRIQKRLGPQHAKEALEALAAGNLRRVAEIMLVYYDKTYARGLSGRNPERTRLVQAKETTPIELAERLKDERIDATNGTLDRI